MQISGTTITLHHHPAVKTPLYPHQCVLFDSWNEREAFILATKTGSGKTAAAALPVIHFRESAVFVYPTNALIEDQERSILGLLEREGYSARVFTPENSNEKYGEEDYHLVRIDASRLEEFRRALKMKDKSQTLLRLIQPSRPKILLINPDLLYLIFSLKYGQASAELTAHFTSYRTAIFDEFHMYSGIELAHALFMVHLIREFGGFNRLVLLSATPYPEVLELLNKALKEPMLINTATNTSRADIGERLSAHSVNFVCQSAGADEVESCFEYLQEKRECLEAARRTNPDAGYVPAVVILNSVVSAIRLEDRLTEAGWERDKIGVVRGLMAKQERQIAGRVVIIGTSAVEVGVDFKTDLLLFEAGDAASFLQRFGRLGRHGSGIAILLGDSREQAAFQSLSEKISREDLEEMVHRLYKGRDALGWFPGTISGALTMIAQAESIRRKVEEDTKGTETAKLEVSAWLDAAIEKFGAKMGWEKHLLQAGKRVKKAKGAGMIGRWINDYIDHVSFRSSMPTITVYDWAEKKRGRSPQFEADLVTLLKWGNRSPKYHEKTDMIYIEGFRAGKPHNLYLSATFENEDTGIMYTTADYPSLKIMQDGHLTSISHLFAIKPYIFVLVPIDFARKLDWRLPWFRCGSQGNKAAVFGGAALVVWEIWKQQMVNRCPESMP